MGVTPPMGLEGEILSPGVIHWKGRVLTVPPPPVDEFLPEVPPKGGFCSQA